jgi:16S rRNA (cytosine1402-N4)-methyltransferase
VARSILTARDRGELRTTADLAVAARRERELKVAAARSATRTFQALRIWVNGELDGLDAFVDTAVECWRPAAGLRSSRFIRSRTGS